MLTTEPLESTQPSRLTWAPGANTRPGFSEDGRLILYSHDHPDTREGNHVPDRCLGVLPATGGQRVATICGVNPPVDPRSGQAPYRYGIEHGALAADGRLAYLLHIGRTNSFGSTSGALYLTSLERPAEARKMLDLKRVPDGALGRWDYLLDMAWVSPGHLVALAAEANLVVPGPFADPDTILAGVEVVELDLTGPEASWTRVAAAPAARIMAWDRTAQRALVVIGNAIIDTRDGTIVHQLVAPAGSVLTEITGLAAAGGEVYLAERSLISTGAGSRAESSISRLVEGGPPERLWTAAATGANIIAAGHLAVDEAGRRVVFERIGAGSFALYLQDLSP